MAERVERKKLRAAGRYYIGDLLSIAVVRLNINVVAGAVQVNAPAAFKRKSGALFIVSELRTFTYHF